ncbi:RNA exonuclease 3 [Venturia nashicola]|uniref:RNA exonuclease 3 n=1 Tax=Venturia nashicola TaxID=86259 RepID=A0A4Z1NV76_9PEZI|nr:RNA exonuclease 3 [Venturia nashicola]TLD28047.1 RNA exonuclease 3 [Venturia nashicola]
MFQSSGLFKSVPCPNGPERCKLTNCIFHHSVQLKANERDGQQNAAVSRTSDSDIGRASGDLKRVKLDNGRKYVPFAEETEQHAKPTRQPFVGTLARSASSNGNPEINSKKKLASSTRSISPPPLSSQPQNTRETRQSTASTTAAKPKVEKDEPLTPRLLKHSPANFTIRHAILLKLHEAMARLNKQVIASSDKKSSPLHLSDKELIRVALDEEEKTAIEQPAVYTNLIKQRIVRYQKMKVSEWINLRLEAVKREIEKSTAPEPAGPKPYAPIKTGLTPKQELTMLERFVLSTQQLRQAEYVISLPTDAEIEEEKKTSALSMGYEPCDRCGTRFQVFPDRREDGALTSNGRCIHHWGKPVFPKREKTDFQSGTTREARYGCCNATVGSPGCTYGETHVFKTSSPRRLAAVLQFEETPPNPKADPDLAVSFDCEMAYTTHGLEVIRLSATTWPQGKALIDVLVRPIGHILDLNTRFSGVTAEQYLKATEYDPECGTLPTPPSKIESNDSTKPEPMVIVPSPEAARYLLFSYISPDTVLIGHALSNDTNVMRIVHHNIVDTSCLYPHPAGLPIRHALRNLSKQFLNLTIQTAGAAGHDSLEDCTATGELVLLKVFKEWEELKSSGWTSKDGKFFAPGNLTEPAMLPPYGKSQGHLKKRKAESGTPNGAGGSAALAEFKARSVDIAEDSKKRD